MGAYKCGECPRLNFLAAFIEASSYKVEILILFARPELLEMRVFQVRSEVSSTPR